MDPAEGVSEVFSTEWIFPGASGPSDGGGVCIFLAGVGGDSSASYIRDVASGIHEMGWVTCAINARGMGKRSPPVKVLIVTLDWWSASFFLLCLLHVSPNASSLYHSRN